jgi:subtilisin family serine protease
MGLAILLSAALWAPHHILVRADSDALTDDHIDAGGVALEPLLPEDTSLTSLSNTYILHLSPHTDPVSAAAALHGSLDPVGHGADVMPDDPEFADQWGLHNAADTDVNAPQAWERTTGGPILVAVLDTGVDDSHPQLAGFVDYGYDFVNDDDLPLDDHGHGTAISSVIAARGNDATGMAGICWDCRILAIKVLDRDNLGLYSWWVRGIDLALTSGASVINLSLGGTTLSSELETAVTQARDAGVPVIAAMMNDGDATPYYPAAYEAAIAVGATNDLGRRADEIGWASSYGDHIDISAPGVLILSAALRGGTEPWSGTSLAVPFVSGASALALTLGPASAEQIRFGLRASAADEEGLPSEDAEGWDPYHGAGRLDLDLFLAAAEHSFEDSDADGVPAGVDCDDEDPDHSSSCPTRGCGCNMVW